MFQINLVKLISFNFRYFIYLHSISSLDFYFFKFPQKYMKNSQSNCNKRLFG